MVMFHHLWPWEWSTALTKVITKFSHISWIGVDLFFVLSGFLITGILLDSRKRPHYFRNFIARRTLRIFPAYYLFLVICLLLLPALFESFNFALPATESPLWYWLYGSNYLWAVQEFKPPEYLGITWSLAVEEQFYLLWPLAVFFLRRYFGVSLVVLISAVLLLRIWLVLSIDAWADATYMSSVCRADSLLIGAAIAYYLRSHHFSLEHWNRVVFIGFRICLPLVIVFQLIFPGRQTPVFSALGYTLLAVGLASLLAHVIQEKPSFSKRIVQLPVFQWFGKYSYGIYLYHMIIWFLSHQFLNAELNVNGEPLDGHLFQPIGGSMLIDAPIRLLACTVATVVTAWLSFRLYERHFLRLKKYF